MKAVNEQYTLLVGLKTFAFFAFVLQFRCSETLTLSLSLRPSAPLSHSRFLSFPLPPFTSASSLACSAHNNNYRDDILIRSFWIVRDMTVKKPLFELNTRAPDQTVLYRNQAFANMLIFELLFVNLPNKRLCSDLITEIEIFMFDLKNSEMNKKDERLWKNTRHFLTIKETKLIYMINVLSSCFNQLTPISLLQSK